MHIKPLNNKGKRSYPELEGKELVWVNPSYNEGVPVPAYVVGCDYYIGVTISETADPEEPLTCINGPLSPEYKNKPMTEVQLKEYNYKFALVLSFIKAGRYDVALKRKSMGQPVYSVGSSMYQCAFGR